MSFSSIDIVFAVLILVLAASQYLQLFTTQWILDKFLGSLLLIIIVIFQHDIRRALTRVGRGVFYPQLGRWEETQMLPGAWGTFLRWR